MWVIFLNAINKISILFFSILFFFLLIESSYYLNLSNLNLNYFIKQLGYDYFKISFFNYVILFIYFFLFFGILDFLYDKIWIKKYSLLLYLFLALLLQGVLYFIIYLNVGTYTLFNVKTVISLYTIISFVVIFNLYSFYYLNFIQVKKIKNKSLPEPITSIFD